MGMLCTSKIDMADTVTAQDVSDFLADTSWTICSTIDIMPEASQFTAIFRRAYYSIYLSLLIGIQLGK